MDETSYSHCPNCLAEYRPGFDTCADCGIPTVPGPAPVTEDHAPHDTKAHRHPTHDRYEVPVILARLPRLEAQILVTKLQAEGLVASADEPALMTAYGAALLALVGTGEYTSVPEACAACITEASSVSPRADESELYARSYQTYRALYPALKPLYAAMI